MRHEAKRRSRLGAGDESTRSDLARHSQTDHLVASGRDIGIGDRQLRRWHRRYEEHGYTGLIDRRRGCVSERPVPLRPVEEVLRLYQEQYFDFNVRHFH